MHFLRDLHIQSEVDTNSQQIADFGEDTAYDCNTCGNVFVTKSVWPRNYVFFLFGEFFQSETNIEIIYTVCLLKGSLEITIPLLSKSCEMNTLWDIRKHIKFLKIINLVGLSP